MPHHYLDSFLHKLHTLHVELQSNILIHQLVRKLNLHMTLFFNNCRGEWYRVSGNRNRLIDRILLDMLRIPLRKLCHYPLGNVFTKYFLLIYIDFWARNSSQMIFWVGFRLMNVVWPWALPLIPGCCVVGLSVATPSRLGMCELDRHSLSREVSLLRE